jgi:hypothetical protein
VRKGANDATKSTIKKQCATNSKALHIVAPPIESFECSKDELQSPLTNKTLYINMEN